MGTVYAFFADGFEEIEAFTAIDTLRRGGLNVEIVSVTPDEIVVGAHDVSVLCDINFDNCDFFDAELLLLPGGMPGAATLDIWKVPNVSMLRLFVTEISLRVWDRALPWNLL